MTSCVAYFLYFTVKDRLHDMIVCVCACARLRVHLHVLVVSRSVDQFLVEHGISTILLGTIPLYFYANCKKTKALTLSSMQPTNRQ